MILKNKSLIVLTLALAFSLSLVSGAADFAVNTFSCTPAEVVINNVFSCTAQVINNGDASGSVNTATLYPDASSWLENSNYAQSSGASVSPGQTTEITFAGLRAIKSGSNGFSKILLDSVTDTYTADNNIEMNVIDVVVSVSNSASSTAMSETFDSTAEVTAGGDIDVTLTFTVNSGGCSIGSQSSTKTLSGMQDGNVQSKSWTVTQGTSGNCRYTISAAATGTGGIATKTDSSSSTVTCSDCPTSSSDSGSSSGSGGGAGSGGGIGSAKFNFGELGSTQDFELGVSETAKFNISNEEHSITVKNLTATRAILRIQSNPQTYTFIVGDEKNIDLNGDDSAEIYLKLKSINIISNKANLILSPISTETKADKSDSQDSNEDNAQNQISGLYENLKKGKLWVIIPAVLIVIGILVYLLMNKISFLRFKKRIKIKDGTYIKV